jgi:hypothetical protein
MMSQLAGWWGGEASLFYTQKYSKIGAVHATLHDVLAMKAWFEQIFLLKGHKKAWTQLSITFFIFKISSLLTEIQQS